MNRRDFIVGSVIAGTAPLAEAKGKEKEQGELSAYKALGTPEEISEKLDELARFHRKVGKSPEYCVDVARRCMDYMYEARKSGFQYKEGSRRVTQADILELMRAFE